MGQFLRHSPCSSCGSSDARAEYDDGSTFCFVCRRNTGGDPLKRLTTAQPKAGRGVDQHETKALPAEAAAWLDKYGLTDDEKSEFSWHPVRRHLIFRDGEFYNARNFGGGTKYVSYGTKPYRIRGTGIPCVLVEDAISGIRIGRQASSLILFGSALPAGKRLLPRRSAVWLDADKWGASVALAFQLRCLGTDCKVIRTELDPKCYSDQEIREIINEW